MRTFKPSWNWRSKSLIAISALFWIAFSFATIFLGFAAIRQFINGIDIDSIAAIALVLVMTVATVVWARGFLGLARATYSLGFLDGLMIWSEKCVFGSRKTRIPIREITGYGFTGELNIGFSLSVNTPRRTYKLGSLLSLIALNEITAAIDQQKAEQDVDGQPQEH